MALIQQRQLLDGYLQMISDTDKAYIAGLFDGEVAS